MQIGSMVLKCFGWKHKSSSRRQYPTVIEELCHPFSVADVKKITNNFDQNRVIVDAFSPELYKGSLQNNDASDCTVIVRRFIVKDTQTRKEFRNEIELLCQLRHPNIVSLIGFCNSENENIVVYEHMSNGSLYQRIRENPEALSWKKRLEICIGAARGLHYLHAGAKRTIIHRHICLANILLDQNMEPKLAEFRFSVQGARFMSKPKPIKVELEGVLGYTAAENFTVGVITDKSDVYSFGMVLLYVACGGRSVKMEPEREIFEEPFEEHIDLKIKGKIAQECWQVFIDIIQRCVKYEPDERLTMGEVEVELEHALSLQEQADIKNTNAHYTLLSNTIISKYLERGLEHALSFEENITEDSDFEDMLP